MTALWKYAASLFFIGLLNNLGYVMVQAGSSRLAMRFHREDAMASF